MKPFLFILLSFIGPNLVTGQNCPPATIANEVILNGNNYSGPIRPGGHPLWGLEENQSQGLKFDDPLSGRVKTIFAQGLWMAGFDPAGNIAAQASTYSLAADYNTFVPGPVDQNGASLAANCTDFDQAWSVRRFEIEAHLADYADNQLIDDPIPAIMGWPGRGNPVFSTYSGFELPDSDDEYAPFLDLNGDGIYAPRVGEYPVEPKQNSIAEQLVWTVSNTTTAQPNADFPEFFPIQLQKTAWAFACTENQQLNDAIFVRYRVDHRGVTDFNSVRFGIWTDFDMGCRQDDYFGVDTLSNTYYAYNMDNDDDVACPGGGMGVGENPPVQSVTWLNQHIASFNYTANFLTDQDTLPDPREKVFNTLHGRWANGQPLEYGGTGYQQGTYEVNHVFTDNPNDANGWSMLTAQTLFARNAIAAANVGNFTVGDSFILDVAYAYHREEGADHLENVNVMLEGVANIQSLYDGNWSTTCAPSVCEDDCVYPGDLNADGIANYVDLVALHFGVNQTGPERLGINSWAPRPADSWGGDQLIGAVDLKHLDANGDGMVNSLDYGKTEDHYNYTRVGYVADTDYTPGPELSLDVINVTNPGTTLEPGELSRACVDVTSNVADLKAVTFELEYDQNHFRGSSVSESSDFSELDFSYTNRVETERYECTLVKAESNFPQNEPTRTLCFLQVTRSDFPTNFPTEPSRIRFRNVRGWLADGTEIEIGGTDAAINIERVTTTNEPTWAKDITIYPNPVTDIINLELNDAPVKKITLHNTLGQVILTSNGDLKQLNTQNLVAGTYFLRLSDGANVVTRKVLKF